VEHGNFEEQAVLFGTYLDHLNILYLFLDSAVGAVQGMGFFNLHEVTNRDLFRTSEGEITGESVAAESLSGTFQMARNFDWHSLNVPIEFHPLFSMRYTVSLSSLARFAETYFLISGIAGAVKTYAGLSRAISAYKIANNETSLVFSWFLIEELLNLLWSEYLDSSATTYADGQQRLNNQRREFLNGRDYTASVKSNMLELAGRLPFDLFSKINRVRGLRNRIVHQHTVQLSHDDARLGITSALEMASSRWQIDIRPPLGFSMQGL
jgi:hypothetical protein